MNTYYEEQNKSQSGGGGDMSSQINQIKSGKVQIPEHFRGKLNHKSPKY